MKIITILLLGLIGLYGCTDQTVVVQKAHTDIGTAKYSIVESSVIKYSAARLAAKPHTGSVTISEGNLVAEDGVFTQGNFIFDMNSITDDAGNERYLNHIKNDDFFGVEQFPFAEFVLKSATDEGSAYTIVGDLTIRDQTNEISFPATITSSGSSLSVQASFSIDRTRWGINYDSGSIFQNLGDRAIKDEIDFTLDVTFNAE